MSGSFSGRCHARLVLFLLTKSRKRLARDEFDIILQCSWRHRYWLMGMKWPHTRPCCLEKRDEKPSGKLLFFFSSPYIYIIYLFSFYSTTIDIIMLRVSFKAIPFCICLTRSWTLFFFSPPPPPPPTLLPPSFLMAHTECGPYTNVPSFAP